MYDQAQSLREIVKKADDLANSAAQSSQTATKVITVTSGKGGVGKSSITVNLAIALSHLGLKVLVIDADFGLANIDVMFGLPARYNLSHFLRGEHPLAQIIQEGYEGVRFISGGSGLFELLRMSEEQLNEVVNKLLSYAEPHDVILFDTGAGVNDTILRLIHASTEVILVTTPEPTAILDAYALLKTVNQESDLPEIRLIMNKADSLKEADNAIASFIRITEKYLQTPVQPLGSILYDGDMGKSIKQQTPILIGRPKSITSRNMVSIAENLLNLPSQHNPTSPLVRLLSRWLRQTSG